MSELYPFHLAIPVRDLQRAKEFYIHTLNCPEGRSSDKWIDFNLFGHQLVIHEIENEEIIGKSNPVDGQDVPVPHFGVVLEWDHWHQFAKELREKGVEFAVEPYIRFEGHVGEQATFFFKDPDGNALEFKAFKNPSQLFAR